MSAEIIATLVMGGVGLVVFSALAVLVVTQTRGLRRDLVGIRGAIGGVEGRLCGRFDSMHGELRDAADRMAYLDGYLTGAAPAIVAAATREIQKREPGTESARELSSTKNPPDAL